jgi:ABC-type phosphate transport system auxiliary subunit
MGAFKVSEEDRIWDLRNRQWKDVFSQYATKSEEVYQVERGLRQCLKNAKNVAQGGYDCGGDGYGDYQVLDKKEDIVKHNSQACQEKYDAEYPELKKREEYLSTYQENLRRERDRILTWRDILMNLVGQPSIF